MFDLYKCMDEDTTIDIAANGRSISRIGEGEFRLIYGRSIKSQNFNTKLADEIKRTMDTPSKALICLPRLWRNMPSHDYWERFHRSKYTYFCKQKEYGSAFVSRPDVVNSIDRVDYWDKMRSIWRNQNVTLVSHGHVLKMPEASNIRLVRAPATNAYQDINEIEEEIGRPSGPIVLCLGATATVLAVRLANKGLHALDLGHLGHFMPHVGAWSVDRTTLISDEYLKENKRLHGLPAGYGGSGHKYAGEVLAFAWKIGAARLLDMGCGRQTLRKKLRELGWKGDILQYDPAIPGLDILPKPADLVISTDVLEHIEPDKLDANLAYLYTLTKRAAFLVVATRPANKYLSDGRNAHLIQQDADWWREKVEKAGFVINKTEVKPEHAVKFWCLKGE